jgi:hypothetical protein
MLSLERELVKKDYINLNENKLLSYGKKYDETKQITLEKINNQFKFSFPMKNSINYAAYFHDKEKLNNYMGYIIKNYLK